MTDPIRTIAAEQLVPATPETVFAFLADLDDHWLLAGRFIEVVELKGPAGARRGGRVRMHGPLGIRRTATTSVEEVDPPKLIRGTATLGTVTRAQVEWLLAPAPGGTDVTLSARVIDVSGFDRVTLAAGGALWLRRRFTRILSVLERHFRAES